MGYDIRDSRPAFKFNEAAMTVTLTVENEDGLEEELTLPAKFEVCSICRGKGTVVNPNIDRHGISPEEFAEDPDFEEAYFSGAYDQSCGWCGGRRVEAVPDPKSDEDKATLKRYNDRLAQLAQWEAEEQRARELGY